MPQQNVETSVWHTGLREMKYKFTRGCRFIFLVLYCVFIKRGSRFLAGRWLPFFFHWWGWLRKYSTEMHLERLEDDGNFWEYNLSLLLPVSVSLSMTKWFFTAAARRYAMNELHIIFWKMRWLRFENSSWWNASPMSWWIQNRK